MKKYFFLVLGIIIIFGAGVYGALVFFQFFAHPTLSITVQDIGEEDIVPVGTEDVTLLRFEAKANKGDVFLTKAVFQDSRGFEIEGVDLFTLWVDSDGDGVAEFRLGKGVSPDNDAKSVTITNISEGGFLIPKEQALIFEVHADIVGDAFRKSGIALEFLSRISISPVGARARNGDPLQGVGTVGDPSLTDGMCFENVCDITIIPAHPFMLWHGPALDITVQDLGEEAFVPVGTEDVTLLRFEAKADRGEVLLTRLLFRDSLGILDYKIAGFQNYRLWVDTDGDAIADTPIQHEMQYERGVNLIDIYSISGGRGYVVPTGEALTFEVHADALKKTSMSQPEIALEFSTIASDSVEANARDGINSLSGIRTKKDADTFSDADCIEGVCDISITTARPLTLWITSVCGNGIVEPDEDCDDGNLEDGDGCDSQCRSGECALILFGHPPDMQNARSEDECASRCRGHIQYHLCGTICHCMYSI